MNTALKNQEGLERKVTVTFTEREVVLLRLFLNLIERNHARGGGVLRLDIQSIREKLTLNPGGRWSSAKSQELSQVPG